MTLDIIFACALVLLAGTCAALVWLISILRNDVTSLRGMASTFERRFVNTAIKLGELQKASPANLAAEVVSLGEAVARLKATHQRFQGRFDQYVTQQLDDSSSDNQPDDPKWLALMQLQQGRANGGT